MPSALKPNATFMDLRSSPKQAEKFLRSVLGVMSGAAKAHGNIVVRMGITGTGQQPNYRIEDDANLGLFAVDGANHDPWQEDARFDGVNTWSSVAMTYEDVQAALEKFARDQRQR